MATLTAWKFDEPDKAEAAFTVLEQLQEQQLISVIDAAWVTWQPGKRAPKTHQMQNTTRAAALAGGFFGFVLGLIFLAPLLGLAVGAAAGAGAGKLADVGIDDRFMADVREKVTPGTSALFALTQDAVQDRVRDAFSGFHAELISSNLSAEQEQKLRETFFAD
jgi:uncharacterized membrane protein